MDSITERRSHHDPPERAAASGESAAPGGGAGADGDGDGAGRERFGQRRPAWLRRHVQVLVAVDALAAALATWLAKMLSFGTAAAELHLGSSEIPYAALMLVSVPTWVAVMGTSRCYDVGPFGTGNGEPRRVVSAAAHFLAVMAVAYYVAHLENLGRSFLIAIVPLAAVLTLAGRAVARAQLRLQHAAGRAQRRAVVLGSPSSARPLLDHLADHPHGGVVPVAVLAPGGTGPVPFAGRDLPVIGEPDDTYGAMARSDADLLIVTGPYAPGRLRQLAWQLEGTGIDVLVAPTLGQLPGPQLDVRPLAGLPLLYVDRTSLGPPPSGTGGAAAGTGGATPGATAATPQLG